jgi:integrase
MDFDAYTVRIRRDYSKTKKERILPITPATAKAIIQLIQQTPEEWGNNIFYSTNGIPMTSEM